MEYKINPLIAYNTTTRVASETNMQEMRALIHSMSSGFHKIVSQHIIPYLALNAELRIREVLIINFLYSVDEVAAAHEISKFVGFDAATVSRSVSRLVDLGIIEKTSSLKDKRLSLLNLTEEGINIGNAIMKATLRIFKGLTDNPDLRITIDEYKQFIITSKKMLGRLKVTDQICTVLDEEFCKNCIQSRPNPPDEWMKSRAECWPCNRYDCSK